MDHSVYFCSFQAFVTQNIVDFHEIQTRIVGIEGEHADHLSNNIFYQPQILPIITATGVVCCGTLLQYLFMAQSSNIH